MPEENAESQKPAKDEMKERHYTITPEERHNIVADFVSDILNSYRSIDWYGISQDWQKKFSESFRIVSGSEASTTEQHAQAELKLYFGIVELSVGGDVRGQRASDGDLKQELSQLSQRLEQTNKAALKMAQILDGRLKDIDDRLKAKGI